MKLRKQLWKDPEMTELARDIQGALDALPVTEFRVLEMPFTATTTLKLPKRPTCIECVRVVDPYNEETAVAHGTAVNFVFDERRYGGCKITRIDGLTAGPTVYKFTFRITWS